MMNNTNASKPTPDEARAALAEAALQKKRAHQLYNRFSGSIFIVWGTIYLIAYGVSFACPELEPIWLPLVLAGFLISFWLGGRMGAFLRSSAGRAFRNVWAGFGVAYFLLGWGFDATSASGQLFSLVVNLFVAYALFVSSTIVSLPTLARAAVVLALTNTFFFVFAPSWYDPAMAGLGLLAVLVGVGMVKNREL